MDFDRLVTIADTADPLVWVVLGAVILAILLLGILVGWAIARRRRRKQYRQRFGPEYDRVRSESNSTAVAEAELERREQRIRQFDIHPLSPAERDQFATEWHSVQGRFVDDPPGAVRDADRLVSTVMNARGYPMGDFEQQAEDLSVEHPRVVDNYRAAHDIAERNERGEADTEDLRQALVHYRALFDDLLVSAEPEHAAEQRPVEAT